MGKEAKYVVRLTDEERQTLQQLVAGPRVARDKALRARMLLKADVDGPGWSDGQIADAFEVGVSTIHRLRQRVVEDRLEVYQRPYDERRPLVCFDEGTKQLVKDVREPLPAAPGHLERVDYEC